jgi:hypothetical protein
VISVDLSLDAAELLLSDGSASGLTAGERETLRTVCVSGMQREELPEGDRIRWARSALAVIDLQHKTSDDPRREAANAAAARAYVIRYLGRAGQDDIGNPTELARYVLAHIHEAREDVALIAPAWRSLPKDRILEVVALPGRAVKFRVEFAEGQGTQTALFDSRAFHVVSHKIPPRGDFFRAISAN